MTKCVLNALTFVALVILVACGGGDSSDSDEPQTTAPAPATAVAQGSTVVAAFEAKSTGTVLKVSNLSAGANGLKAEVTIENTGEVGQLTLELAASQALLLNDFQAETWRKGYPKAFQEADMKKFAAESPSALVELTVGSTDTLPKKVAAGDHWSGTITTSTPVSSDVTAVVIILKNFGMERRNNGSLDQTLYSSDETRPYIGLQREVTVTPLPPIEALALKDGDKIAIPKISIDQPLVLLTVGRDGAMPNAGQQEIALYDFATFGEGLAGSPRSGNAVISAFHSNRNGPGPFLRILSLSPGDLIDLVYQGTSYRYTVAWKCAVPTTNFDEIIRKGSANTLTFFPGIGGATQYVIRAELNVGSISKECPANTTVFSGTDVPRP